jgi:hypothetical protein
MEAMMTIFLRLAAGTLAAAPVLASFAQTDAAPATPRPGVQVSARAPQPYRNYYVPPETMRMLRGAYRMDDGSLMRVRDWHRELKVDYLGTVTPLRAAAEDVYVSRDRAMVLVVVPNTDSEMVVLSYRPAAALAAAPVLLGATRARG